MNEQALQQLYRLAKGEGYQKGYSDFKTLMATNEEAISNMYEISKIEGYQKSIDDFKVLVGFDVKKKDDSQPTLETEVTTESTTGQVPGEDTSSDSDLFDYNLADTEEELPVSEETVVPQTETQFDPSTLPKEPLVKDAYPGLFQGESAFVDRVADKVARKYNKAGENVEEVFPDMYKDVFEEVRDERKFIESYDELPEEVKTRIEPGVVRENGEVIGVNQSLIPNQNIEEIVKLYETEEIGDAGLQSGLIENFADVIENQKREDYSIKIKKVGQLQEDIKNTKEKITQLQEQGNNLLADQLSIPLNETIEEYNNLIKEANEDGILINSLDIISENEDMLAPLSGVSSAASELVSRTVSALPVVFGTLASVAGKTGFMTSAQSNLVSESLMQDALKLEDEVRDFFPKDYRDKKMNFTGEVVGQIGFIVGSGIFLGGTPAVVAAGYTMSASEMYREATDSGLSHEDAMNLSMAYGAISAPLEMWGASRAIGAVEGKLLRKKILNEILESGAKGFTREAAEKVIKVSYKPILTETLKESLEEGFQEGTQFLLSKGLAEAYNATKDEDKPEFLKASIKSEEFWLQAWDNFLAGTVGGGIGGVSLNVAGGNIFVGNDYKAIEKMFTDPKQMAKVDAQLNSYRKTGKIETDEELQAAKEQVGIVSQAAAEVRNATKTNRITVGNQKQLFKLTAERISLQKETEGVTVPSLIADKKQRIEELDKNIQDIIAGKVVQPLETQETAPKVTTEGIEDAEVEEEVDEKVVNETKRVDNIFNETNPEVAETLSDNLVRNKSAEFELSSIGQSIVNQATKAAVAIQRVAPNVRVVLHDTSKEYTDFGREGTRGSYDPATKTIHIDLSKANKRTVGHETFHSILLESIKSDVELQKLTDDMYKTVNRSLATNPFLKRKLRKFSEKYADNIRSEEALSELFGMLSSDYKKLSAPVKIKIKQFVNKVATKFGLGDIIKLSEQDLSDIDTIDLLNTMAARVKEGEAIAEEETKPLTDRDAEGKVSDKQTDRKARGQLNESESNEVSKSVEDRTIKGEKVSTFLKFKVKDKVEFLSFEGEINQENVKEIAPQSYNTTASKLSTYNTFGIDNKAALMESIEGVSKKEINKKLNENKLIIDKAILKYKKNIDKIKGKKSLTREEKKVEINQQKEIIDILRDIRKSKDLVSQFESVMSIEIKVLSDSLYNSMFYNLGPKLSKLKTKELLEKSDNIYSKAKEIVKSNLLSVYNSVSPSIRKISKLWYDGANLIAQEMASSYDVTTEQAAAIIATQSPQMPWFDNLHLADVIMDTLRNRSEELFTQEMFDYYVLKSKDYPKQIKYIPTLRKQVGKKLNELSDYDAGIFVRVDYDLNISRKAPIRIPTGTAVKESQKGDSSFGGYPVIEKGVAVFRDGSINNISNQLGRANKVRNFYVNIVNPSDRRAVTIDTHAMAIALFKPLASNDIEVNFGPASFAFYADAYRELAEELGIEARALQSITWEAARAIFPASKKAQEGYKDSISKIWDKFSSKEQTLEQVQEQIYNQANDPNITEWSDYINELKNEKTRENVSGRIIRFDGAKTSDKLGDVSKPDSRVSTSRRRPISDDKTTVTTRAVREQKLDTEEVYSKIGKTVKQVEEWKDNNKKGIQMPYPKKALDANLKYSKGEITLEEKDKVIKEEMPITPYDTVPTPATIDEIVLSLDKNKVKLGIIGLTTEIKDGQLVSSRLDIPAYTNFGIYVDTIHGPGGKGVLGYSQVAVLKDVTFKSSAARALQVATKEKNKSPFGIMDGSYLNESTESVVRRAEEALKSDEWIQVGFNPYRHSYFYDKANSKRVVSADEIIQVGPLVMAKGAKTEKGPLESTARDGSTVRFQLNDEYSITEKKGVFILTELGKRIGEIVTSSYSIPNYKNVALSFINLDKRGKGLGKELYREVATILGSRGEVLVSSGFRNDASNNVWRSLVEDGYAEEIGKNKANGESIYAMLPDDPLGSVATEAQQQRAVREQKVDSKSFKNILSKITNITKIDLKEQIQIAKDLKKRARLTKKEKKILDDSLNDTLKELEGQGKLTTFQVKAVLRKFQNVDVFSTSQVESFVDYMAKVFADADYLAKVRDADSKLPKARNNIKKGKTGINEVGPLLSKLFRINPRLIPSQFLDKYLDIVDTLSKRKKELELDLESITKNAEEILNYMDSEFSRVNWLASGFEDYVAENKSKVKGKTFTEIVSLMREEGVIDDSDVAIMKKYQSIISPTKKTTKTEQEIQEEKDELIESIKENAKENNPIFSTNEELALAKQLKELIDTKGIEELSVNELKTLLQVINNINQGLVTNNASELRIKLDSLKNSSPVEKSLLNATVGAIEKRYNKVKSFLIRGKKNYIQKTLESNPLYYIDQVFGDGKTKDLFNSLIRGMAEGEQNFNYDIRKIYKKLDDASDAVRKSFKGSRNKLIESSAKQFFYMLELEYNSNQDKTKVKRASEYLEETIKLAKVNKRDIDMLEKIKKAYVVDGKVDMDKLYSSFNSAEKKSIKVAQEINQSLAPKALFVAGVIRGQRIGLLNNYVHHVVVDDKFKGDVIDDSHSLMKSMNESLKPSTKAKSVIERQNVVTALNFDIYNSVKRGSKSTLLDFHLTVPIKTSRATLKETKKALEKDGSYESKKDIYEGLDSLMESTISNFIHNSVASSGDMIGEKVLARIAKIGYQRVLGDTKRMTRELISNMSFILNRGREEYYEGLKYRGVSSETTAQAMRNLGSLQTGRLFSDLGIKSRFTEKLFEDKLGVRGKENKSKIMDTLGIINYYSLNPLARGVDALADGIISKPDQIMSRPLWKGAFASTFKQETGQPFPEDGFERIAANDQAFMSKHKNALEVATKKADDISIEAAASSGLFTGISRGKDASRKRDIGGMFFANFNNYMSTFLNYEYQSFRKGLMAARGNGIISEKEGRQLMAAVSTRMFMYTFLSSVITKGLLGILRSILGYAEGEEEEDKNLLKEGGKSVIQTLIGLFLGRNFGNLTKGIQNTIIEGVNEKYLDFLRDGEYDKYKDSLGYPLAPKKKDYEDAKIGDYIYTFSGPYGKALELGDKALKVKDDILEPSKKADAKKREKQRLKRFVFFEIPAFFGYAPFAREIEKELNSYMYKDFRKGGKSEWIDVGPTEAEEKKSFKQIDPEGYKEIYGK